MKRQTRNWILLWIIILGLTNFVSYTVMYWYLQGDAKNGAFVDGSYYVRGHFIHGAAGEKSQVGRGLWLYSYIHSISIWPTVGAVLIAMFILARPHIIATMGTDAVISGRTFIAVCITVIVLITGASTVYFILSFINALTMIGRGESWGV